MKKSALLIFSMFVGDLRQNSGSSNSVVSAASISSSNKFEYEYEHDNLANNTAIIQSESPTSSLNTTSPTYKPTKKPTHVPTHRPTYRPTHIPTHKPTGTPTKKPTTFAPSSAPFMAPTNMPSARPSEIPSRAPSSSPSHTPSNTPSSSSPSQTPSLSPTTSAPSLSPTLYGEIKNVYVFPGIKILKDGSVEIDLMLPIGIQLDVILPRIGYAQFILPIAELCELLGVVEAASTSNTPTSSGPHIQPHSKPVRKPSNPPVPKITRVPTFQPTTLTPTHAKETHRPTHDEDRTRYPTTHRPTCWPTTVQQAKMVATANKAEAAGVIFQINVNGTTIDFTVKSRFISPINSGELVIYGKFKNECTATLYLQESGQAALILNNCASCNPSTAPVPMHRKPTHPPVPTHRRTAAPHSAAPTSATPTLPTHRPTKRPVHTNRPTIKPTDPVTPKPTCWCGRRSLFDFVVNVHQTGLREFSNSLFNEEMLPILTSLKREKEESDTLALRRKVFKY